MDHLLWAILQVSPLPNVLEPESHLSEVGNEEIQEVEEALQEGCALAGTDCPSEAKDVCPLGNGPLADGWAIRAG